MASAQPHDQPIVSIKTTGFLFLAWYAVCLTSHLSALTPILLTGPIGGADIGAVPADNLCLFADVGGVAGTILLILCRKQATYAFAGALMGALVFQFYRFYLDPSFAAPEVIDIMRPAAATFIAIGLVWYSHIANDNEWLS